MSPQLCYAQAPLGSAGRASRTALPAELQHGLGASALAMGDDLQDALLTLPLIFHSPAGQPGRTASGSVCSLRSP